MLRRTVLPLAVLAVAFGAFAAAAAGIADGDDLAGIYFVALAAVALKLQSRLATTGAS